MNYKNTYSNKKIDNKEYKMYDCVKPVPKYQITKNEKDKFTITDMKYKGYSYLECK